MQVTSKLANQNAQKALFNCVVYTNVSYFQLTYGDELFLHSCPCMCHISTSSCYLSPSQECPHRLDDTSHYTENTAHTPGCHLAFCKHGRCPLLLCGCVDGMVPAVLFMEKEPSLGSRGSGHNLGHTIVSPGLCHGTNLLQKLVQTSHSHLSLFAFGPSHLKTISMPQYA